MLGQDLAAAAADPCVTARLTWMQNYLLAELIKAANPHPDVFLAIIRQHNIPLRWDDIPLPPSQSLQWCCHTTGSTVLP